MFIDCGGLTLSETKEYINHQLDIVKCKNSIFDERCFPIIHSLASGSPRKINQFCYASLFEAYKDKTSVITDEILKKVEVKLAYGQQRL